MLLYPSCGGVCWVMTASAVIWPMFLASVMFMDRRGFFSLSGVPRGGGMWLN